MIKEIYQDAKDRMSKSIDVFHEDLNSIRAGRANPTLLDRIEADYYGVMTPIKQLGNISAPEPRMILIQPWDANVISAIEKAIQVSDLGLNPSNDGKVIRLVIPQLTEERRKELIKVVSKNSEEAKVNIRNIRRDSIDKVKSLEKNKEITEDDRREAEDEIQKITDSYIKKIEEIQSNKEKELIEI